MAGELTKNSRNARLLLGTSFAAANMAIVTKTNGLSLELPTDFSDSTGHGENFKTYEAGQQDWKAKIKRWYDAAYRVMVDAAYNKTKLAFAIYPDYADTTRYWSGYCYLSLQEQNMDLGNTIAETFELVHAGGAFWTAPA